VSIKFDRSGCFVRPVKDPGGCFCSTPLIARVDRLGWVTAGFSSDDSLVAVVCCLSTKALDCIFFAFDLLLPLAGFFAILCSSSIFRTAADAGSSTANVTDGNDFFRVPRMLLSSACALLEKFELRSLPAVGAMVAASSLTAPFAAFLLPLFLPLLDTSPKTGRAFRVGSALTDARLLAVFGIVS
jgi:hypothetical protein